MNGTAQMLHNENALVVQSLAEPKAFAEIYDHYFPRVYTYIRYRVNDDATADDLTALVFERALSQIHKFQPERAPFAAWLFGIARHTVGNHHRRKRRWQWFSLESHEEHHDEAPPLEEILVQGEMQAELLKAVSSLKPREQDLIILKFVTNLTHRDIAHMVGLTESNVSVILFRALQKLRDLLAKETDTDEQ